MDYWILVLAFLAGLAIGIRPTPTPVETAFFAVSHCISYRFIIKKAFRYTSLSKNAMQRVAWHPSDGNIIFESECNERFFVRDEIPYFCKQPAVSL